MGKASRETVAAKALQLHCVGKGEQGLLLEGPGDELLMTSEVGLSCSQVQTLFWGKTPEYIDAKLIVGSHSLLGEVLNFLNAQGLTV